MASLSNASQEKLDTCDERLVMVCETVIQVYDFTVLEGYRSGERQDELFRQGKSKLQAGESKHNRDPSLAVDLAPYPILWSDSRRFYFLAGLMQMAGKNLGVTLRFGGDWDGDGDLKDQSFFDLVHFEVVE